jgi:hypothetical protein
MERSILQQYWMNQGKKQPMYSTSNNVVAPFFDTEVDPETNRSDNYALESVSEENSQILSNNLSPANATAKEFYPVEQEKEDENNEIKRFELD